MVTNRDKGAGLKSAIGTLIDAQCNALERATFVGMNAEETAEYDDRAERIRRLEEALNRAAPDKSRHHRLVQFPDGW